MASLNLVTIMGNLGQDPEMKSVGEAQTLKCILNVATSEKQKDGKEVTEWHRVIAWGKTAENCGKYLAKGRTVVVVGRLQTNKWEKDGVKHSRTEIIAERVQFVGGQKGAGEKSQAQQLMDDLPDFGM